MAPECSRAENAGGIAALRPDYANFCVREKKNVSGFCQSVNRQEPVWLHLPHHLALVRTYDNCDL